MGEEPSGGKIRPSSSHHKSLSDQLLRYFEAAGDFYVDSAAAPWMRLPLADGQAPATGLSRAQVLAGIPRVAALVLAAVIDYNLRHPSAAERVDYVMGCSLSGRQT